MDEKYRLIVAEIKELVARLDNRELGSSELKRKRDRNTIFFHRHARIRSMRSGIMGVQYNGRWETKP
ncbi:hypothetical protein V6N12_062590 [Hibiscus sabdariffa]|uniref:Uncharacterized protein n=1 Tax=Hibiscus sabdariffa TaxID=183260 RepID=A0ABR2F9B1_9ROSI